MIETILAGLTKDIVKSLSQLATNEITKVLCVKNEINKLKTKLESMEAIIRDAEQTVVKNEVTRDWLKRVREITYEAENIIDRCRIEEERLQMSHPPQECNPSSVFRLCRDVVIDCMIASDVHELNQKLESIKLESAILHLNPVKEDQIRSDLDIAPDLEPDIVGKEVENDCDNIIQLLEREYHTRSRCPLFAIVGTIGVGKTTLARKIYHKAATMYETRLWVHVSKDLQHLTMWSDGTFRRAETATLREQLRTCLEGKKFLLVIDDVWGEDVWDGLLETQAQYGTPGSRVLITTRDERVARRTGAIHLHRVKCLNEDDGWWLLRTRAFLDESTGNMQDIGRRIVQKCNGLPMAIRRIGCHLREVDPKEDDWERIYSSDFCGISLRLKSAINLSYVELPFYLKRCFLYCSLYPEGYVIERQHITRQWIAEGFIVNHQLSANTTIEEEAERCYEELLGRGLLLPENVTSDAVGSKMPHLFRSFAFLQSQDENFTGNPQDVGDVLKLCRLSITNGDAAAIRNGTKKLKNLRTILLFGSPLNDSTLSDICQKFTQLRVLDLENSQIECVTGSLGRMTHLRYLSFANTQVREIPSTIENLRMLQFLILKNCIRLDALPGSVGRLINLRSLEIPGTGLNNLAFKFSMMKELNCLKGFFVSSAGAEHKSGLLFQELSSLTKLTSLQILRIERALNTKGATQSALMRMHNLKNLELCCSIDSQIMDVSRAENVRAVFEALQPVPSVVSIKLENYYSHKFPSWISPSKLPQLQRLILDGCSHIQHVPSLGEMKNLKFLAIVGSSVSSAIGPEIRGEPDNGVAFPKLEQLLISNMSNLKSWWGLEGDMPLLVNFRLDGCPNLDSLPSWLKHCTALRSLQIDHADSLEAIENLPALKELKVHRNGNLKKISDLERLEVLKVVHCLQLEVVQGAPSLHTVYSDEDNSTELPQWLHLQEPFVLKRLEIVGTEELLDRCSSTSSPYYSVIQNADHVYANLPDGSFYFSYTKNTNYFHRSARSLARSSLYNFTVPVPQDDDVILTDETKSSNMKAGQSTSYSWVRTELFTVLLFAAAHIFFLSTGYM